MNSRNSGCCKEDEGGLSPQPMTSRRLKMSFLATYAVANMAGLAFVALMVHWLKEHSGGLSWSKSLSNFHPLFMTIFLFLYGNGMLTYRLMRNSNKKFLKIIHAVINGTAGGFALTAMSIVFWENRDSTNLYSLHSWIGLSTVILYEINFLGGLLCFFVPATPEWIRSKILPFHVFAGHALIAMIVTSIYSGISRKIGWSKSYSNFSHLGLVANFYGLMLLIFALAAGFLVTYAPFKRHPLPSETSR